MLNQKVLNVFCKEIALRTNRRKKRHARCDYL